MGITIYTIIEPCTTNVAASNVVTHLQFAFPNPKNLVSGWQKKAGITMDIADHYESGQVYRKIVSIYELAEYTRRLGYVPVIYSINIPRKLLQEMDVVQQGELIQVLESCAAQIHDRITKTRFGKVIGSQEYAPEDVNSYFSTIEWHDRKINDPFKPAIYVGDGPAFGGTISERLAKPVLIALTIGGVILAGLTSLWKYLNKSPALESRRDPVSLVEKWAGNIPEPSPSPSPTPAPAKLHSESIKPKPAPAPNKPIRPVSETPRTGVVPGGK